jgi:RNA polymerase-binding protein DksA
MREDQQATYRERLLSLRGRLVEEVRDTVSSTVDKAAATDELSHIPSHPADRDSEGLERELVLEANREQMLEEIDASLTRIDDGSYGRCEGCGGPIPRARSEVLPFALRCVECEAKREEG